MTRRYIYADESGNFDFSRKQDATRYFAVGSIAIDGEDVRRKLYSELDELMYALTHAGHELPGYFHATTDKQAVRDEVYKLIKGFNVSVDVTVLDKRKAQPSIRTTDGQFYKYAWWFHFNKLGWALNGVDDLVIVGASLGSKKKKLVFQDAIKDVVAQKCPARIPRKIASWSDESSRGLQAADYLLWAVMRDLERGDDRSRKLMESRISSCFEPFSQSTKEYY